MHIVQMLPTISYGDAVSNDALALDQILKNQRHTTSIIAENIGKNISTKIAQRYTDSYEPDKNDLLIYHLSTGTKLNTVIKRYNCKKIMIYHNITPMHFFSDYNPDLAELCRVGREEARQLKDTFDYVLADSEYNKSELLEMGYTCPIDVLPILIPFEDYEMKPDNLVLKRYKDDGFTNILFVGRIAPNKKQEDIITSFYHYQKNYNSKSRLFIVGSSNGMDRYYNRLKEYTEKLGVENVEFLGHIKFNAILAYYKLADIFLCLSEHEGFCVPLVEAMNFNIPIVAYHSSAIKETLGGSGFLLEDKNPLEVAGVLNKVAVDDELKRTLVENEKERLKDFDNQRIGKMFLDYLNKFLKGEINEKNSIN